MSKPTVLAEPLTLGQETIVRETLGSRKILAICSLLVGLVFALSFTALTVSRGQVDDSAVDMFGAQLAKTSQMNLVAHVASSPPQASYRPHVRAEAMRGSYMQPSSAAVASPMSMSCPRGAKMSVSAMQDTLRKYGYPSSPLEKYALTEFAATRDVSMAAQAKEEFSKLDPVTQAKFNKLKKDIVVKASTLKPEDMPGILAPTGFFDPLGLSKKGNLAVFRAAELKHGRVCMLAVLGIIWTEAVNHPFFDAWGDGEFVSAISSHFSKTAAANFWPAFWVMAAGHEFATELNAGRNPDYKAKLPGDFGWDPLNITKQVEDPEGFRLDQDRELSNGRLAMLGAAGIIAQELVTGKKIFG